MSRSALVTRKFSLGRNLRYVARTILSVVTVFWLGFALLSGAENAFEGLLAVLDMVFRREMLGGALASAIGFASVFFFITGQLCR